MDADQETAGVRIVDRMNNRTRPAVTVAREERGSPSPRSLGLAAILLLAYIVTQFGYAWRLPFVNEDYAFLDSTRHVSLVGLLRLPGLYSGPWFRPWSQGVHYWFLGRVFGTRTEGWHIVGAILLTGILTSYFALVRRVAGPRPAAVATACTAAMVGWGVLATWIAGVQDLWMLFFAMAALHAFVRARTGWATLALALALLSKESAAVIPALATAWCVLVGGLGWRRTAIRTAPLWGLLIAWAILYAAIGGGEGRIRQRRCRPNT